MKLLMSEKIAEVIAKLAKVRHELDSVTKKSDNPFFKSSYADLNEHLDTVEPVFKKHGLTLLQPCSADEHGNYVTSLAVDSKTGQYIGSSLRIPSIKDAQKELAGVTYFRRGTLNALLALKSVDDDGETVSGRGEKKNNFKKNKFKNKKRSSSNDEF